MAPLNVEVYSSEEKNWLLAGKVDPGNIPGTISDNRPDGTRQLYIFDCSDNNSKSTIYRSNFGIDITEGNLRQVLSEKSKWEVVKILTASQTYQMEVTTDTSQEPLQIRFTHVEL